MPEDIGAGPQPPSTELLGLTPEQNQEVISLRQKSAQSAEEFEESGKEYARLNEQREDLNNAANLVFNKFIYSPDSSVTEEEKAAANLVYHRLYNLVLQKDDERLQPQQKFYNDMSQDIHDQSKAEEHFREHEEGYKEQAVIEAQADGVDVHYPPYTDTEDRHSEEIGASLEKLKSRAVEVGRYVDDLKDEIRSLDKFLERQDIDSHTRTELSNRVKNAHQELTEANERFSRLGHEISLQETRDSGNEDAILPPEDAPYKHEGKTPEQVMTELRNDQDALREDVANKERQTFGDLRNELTDAQAEDFDAVLGRQIRGEAPMTLDELQALRSALDQVQFAKYGPFLDKKIGDLEYEAERDRNIEARRQDPTWTPERAASAEPTFPSILEGAPESPIDTTPPQE